MTNQKKYKIIYADPPWRYDDKSLSRESAEGWDAFGNEAPNSINIPLN